MWHETVNSIPTADECRCGSAFKESWQHSGEDSLSSDLGPMFFSFVLQFGFLLGRIVSIDMEAIHHIWNHRSKNEGFCSTDATKISESWLYTLGVITRGDRERMSRTSPCFENYHCRSNHDNHLSKLPKLRRLFFVSRACVYDKWICQRLHMIDRVYHSVLGTSRVGAVSLANLD